MLVVLNSCSALSFSEFNYDFLAPATNSDGDTPVQFLKNALKLAGSEKPSL